MNISINTDKTLVYYGSSINVAGKLTNELNKALSSATVKLMNSNTQLDTATTDIDGNYSFNKQLAIGNYNLTVVYDGDGSHESITSASKTVTCRKYNTNITINTDKSTVYYSQQVAISGKLTNELGANISGATVKLYNGNSHIATTTTGSNGTYSFTRSWSQGNYEFKVVYDGDSTHTGVTSSTKNVTMSKAPTSITTTLPDELYVGDTLPIKVVSSYGSFNPSSVTVEMYGSSQFSPDVSETLTEKDASGNFNFTIPSMPSDDYSISIRYDGTSNYAASSKTGSIYIIEADVGSITLSKTGNTLSAKFKDSNNNIIPNTLLTNVVFHFTINGQVKDLIVNETTDANGNIQYSVNFGNRCYVTYSDITSNTISW